MAFSYTKTIFLRVDCRFVLWRHCTLEVRLLFVKTWANMYGHISYYNWNYAQSINIILNGLDKLFMRNQTHGFYEAGALVGNIAKFVVSYRLLRLKTFPVCFPIHGIR